MEINTTGGRDPLVPTSESGIRYRYSVNLRILELCIEVPPRSLTACVAHAHDEIVDTSATQYVFTVKSLNTLRNFVRLWAQVSRNKRTSGTDQGSPLGQERQSARAFSGEIVGETNAFVSTEESEDAPKGYLGDNAFYESHSTCDEAFRAERKHDDGILVERVDAPPLAEAMQNASPMAAAPAAGREGQDETITKMLEATDAYMEALRRMAGG